MKYFVHILSILVLVIGFSSCQKSESDGFEEAEVFLQSKALQSSEDSDDEDIKPTKSYRDAVIEIDDHEDENITDDEDDEDEDENNPSANR